MFQKLEVTLFVARLSSILEIDRVLVGRELYINVIVVTFGFSGVRGYMQVGELEAQGIQPNTRHGRSVAPDSEGEFPA